MDKIELIRAEIERRLAENEIKVKSNIVEWGAIREDKELLEYLNSLPEGGTEKQEKVYQASEELYAAAKEYAQGEGMEDACGGWEDMSDAFITGAQWQKEQMEERWLKDREGCFWDGVEEGKKVMKEQMMKEAVEGEACILGRVAYVKEESSSALKQYILDNFKNGDKVKIIIVKED